MQAPGPVLLEIAFLAGIVGWVLATVWPHYKPEYVFALRDQSSGWLACRYLLLVCTTLILPEAWRRSGNLRNRRWVLVYVVCVFTVLAAISSYDFVAWLLVGACVYVRSG